MEIIDIIGSSRKLYISHIRREYPTSEDYMMSKKHSQPRFGGT